jgi:hypothetical protein
MGQKAQGKTKATTIARVLWKEILPGDRRKFIAASNDVPTGGGARDLRFRGDEELEKIILAMFPHAEDAVRRRKSGENVTRYRGTFCWNVDDGGKTRTKTVDAYMEPPTDARAREWRIVRVHKYEVFQAALPPESDDDRVLLLLIQTGDGNIWPRFTTESSLREDKWSKDVKKHIIGCLSGKKSKSRTAYGFIDLQTDHEYCHV